MPLDLPNVTCESYLEACRERHVYYEERLQKYSDRMILQCEEVVCHSNPEVGIECTGTHCGHPVTLPEASVGLGLAFGSLLLLRLLKGSTKHDNA